MLQLTQTTNGIVSMKSCLPFLCKNLQSDDHCYHGHSYEQVWSIVVHPCKNMCMNCSQRKLTYYDIICETTKDLFLFLVRFQQQPYSNGIGTWDNSTIWRCSTVILSSVWIIKCFSTYFFFTYCIVVWCFYSRYLCDLHANVASCCQENIYFLTNFPYTIQLLACTFPIYITSQITKSEKHNCTG